MVPVMYGDLSYDKMVTIVVVVVVAGLMTACYHSPHRQRSCGRIMFLLPTPGSLAQVHQRIEYSRIL